MITNVINLDLNGKNSVYTMNLHSRMSCMRDGSTFIWDGCLNIFLLCSSCSCDYVFDKKVGLLNSLVEILTTSLLLILLLLSLLILLHKIV